jgi:hypothetical protein
MKNIIFYRIFVISAILWLFVGIFLLESRTNDLKTRVVTLEHSNAYLRGELALNNIKNQRLREGIEKIVYTTYSHIIPISRGYLAVVEEKQ